jgi:hypothetical protein
MENVVLDKGCAKEINAMLDSQSAILNTRSRVLSQAEVVEAGERQVSRSAKT